MDRFGSPLRGFSLLNETADGNQISTLAKNKKRIFNMNENNDKKPQILVCDDEPDILSAVRIYLSTEGYEVLEAKNGEEALLRFHSSPEISLVVLDIMMPKKDGIAVLSEIRQHSNVPVILLTAKSEDADIVLGLSLGADDYITKPFHPAELLARVKSSLRRYLLLGGAQKDSQKSDPRDEFLSVGGIDLDDRRKQVFLDGDPISLTPTEFDILKLLMENTGKVFSPKEIYERVWKEDSFGGEGTVAVHVRHIREKVEYDKTSPRHLKAVWGRGYVFE